LRSIASKFYGNPSLWETIYNANEKNISRGLPITGKTFTIPPPPSKR
jgi:nucleoid-associated protein YgaU